MAEKTKKQSLKDLILLGAIIAITAMNLADVGKHLSAELAPPAEMPSVSQPAEVDTPADSFSRPVDDVELGGAKPQATANPSGEGDQY